MATYPASTGRGSLDEFASSVRPRICRMVRRWGVPAEDAEDLVQQALLALVDCWDRVRNPEAWVAGTARKCCLMYWRSHRRRIYEAVDDGVLDWLAEPERPTQERHTLRREIATVASGLPAHYRSVLRMRYGLGYDPREIAHRLGYRPSSIGKVTTRGLAALRGAVREAAPAAVPPG